MVEIGAYRLDLISDGFFEDDADTFVRQCVEGRSAPRLRVKSKVRIKVGFNSLLIRGEDRTVVVDPGTGDKPREDMRRQYRLEWPRRFLPALEHLGVGPEDVDAVILTHLHWDHCGACTRLDAAGEPVPTFPRARHYVQRRELEAARSGREGYTAADFEPLAEAGLLELVEGDREILPGISIRLVGGHCPGLQIVMIGPANGPRALYVSDLIPTATQLPLECGLSYDENLEELKAAKARVLAEAVTRRDLLLFVHAPRLRAGYPVPHADGAMQLEAVNL